MTNFLLTSCNKNEPTPISNNHFKIGDKTNPIKMGYLLNIGTGDWHDGCLIKLMLTSAQPNKYDPMANNYVTFNLLTKNAIRLDNATYSYSKNGNIHTFGLGHWSCYNLSDWLNDMEDFVSGEVVVKKT